MDIRSQVMRVDLSPDRGRLGRLLMATVLGLSATIATATPMVPDGGKGVFRWPDGTDINVYIPFDPTGGGREIDIGAGVLAWNGPELQAKNIKINVFYGPAEADAKNVVNVIWHDGKITMKDGKKVDGTGSPEGDTTENGAETDGGTIEINKDKKISDEDAKNLGAHEMGHVLGISDSSDPDSVMNPEVDNAKPKASDIKELLAVLNATQDDSHIQVNPSVDPLGNLFRYTYDVEWQGGTELALFQVDIGNAVISSIEAPLGWAVVDSRWPDDVNPQFTSLYAAKPYIGFVLDDELHYIGAAYPNMTFAFVANQRPGRAEIFLNGRSFSTGPVPEPAACTLMILGFGLIGSFARRRVEIQPTGKCGHE